MRGLTVVLRIGRLSIASRTPEVSYLLEAFSRGLRELGYGVPDSVPAPRSGAHPAGFPRLPDWRRTSIRRRSPRGCHIAPASLGRSAGRLPQPGDVSLPSAGQEGARVR